MTKRRRKKRARQLALDFTPPPTSPRGGRRDRAGRPRGERPRVWHRARPPHKARHPVHITLRARRGLPSFVQERVRNLVKLLLGDRWRARRGYRDAFRIVHFSIQSDHLHLIVESLDVTDAIAHTSKIETAQQRDAGRALRAGVSGFVIAFARRLNAMLGRKGKVWDSRYHRHDLRTPTETKNTLRYVLLNGKKHGRRFFGAGCVDLYSSAHRFDGWEDADLVPRTVRSLVHDETEPWPDPRPPTWLLTKGWRRAGPLFTSDRPA